MFEFNYEFFSKDDLETLNKEKNPDGYGVIYVTSEKQEYIVDVTYETKEAYDRNGICLEVYEANNDYSHGCWVESIKDITKATNYKRFQTRANKLICQAIEDWETVWLMDTPSKRGSEVLKFWEGIKHHTVRTERNQI